MFEMNECISPLDANTCTIKMVKTINFIMHIYIRRSFNLTQENNITVYSLGIAVVASLQQLQVIANGGVSNERVSITTDVSVLARFLTNIYSEVVPECLEGRWLIYY